MDITVGCLTAGFPEMETHDGITTVKNMVTGKNFHWESAIECRLPGVCSIDEPSGMLLCRLPLETYLECVVGSEMNPKAPAEFLKAHAIVSRSWAVDKILRLHSDSDEGKIRQSDIIVDWRDSLEHKDDPFDVCSDDHCQRFQGLQPISSAALDALQTTRGLVLADADGNIVDARFSKCCGGHTEEFETCWQDEHRNCLEAFPDKWCDLSDMAQADKDLLLSTCLKDYDQKTSDAYRWIAIVDKEKLRSKVNKRFPDIADIGRIISLNPVKRGKSGRISLLGIKGENASVRIGKELAIRELLSDTHLYSSAFEAEDRGDYFLLHGKGWGHGVGLCQTGAARMAFEGKTMEEILSFYYPGSKIIPLDSLQSNK